MRTLFLYNWTMRDEWFRWCEEVPQVELSARRAGGHGSILRTLFHIVDEEQSWMREIAYGTTRHFDYDDYAELDAVRGLSNRLRPFVKEVVDRWSPETDGELRTVGRPSGEAVAIRLGDLYRHAAVHEIHHAGRLAVWARELGAEPVGAGLLRRESPR